MSTIPLTDRQERLLRIIETSVTKRGYVPTLQEMATAMGITSLQGVKDHLTALERKGYLRRAPGHRRAMEIIQPITLAVELGCVETFPGGPRHAGFEATTQIKRKDFDIDVALPPGVSAVALGDVIKIEIDLQLLEPEQAA